MKRVQMLVMIFIFIFMITPATFASLTNASSVQISRTGWVPIELTGLNNCNGEDFSFTGMQFVEIQITEDGSGGAHVKTIDRIRGTAVGLTTGAKYLDAGEGGVAIEHLTTFNGTYIGTLQINGTLISMDKEVPSLHYKIFIHVTFDANGNLKASVYNFEIICQ